MEWSDISERITYAKLYGKPYDDNIQCIVNYFDALYDRNDLVRNKIYKSKIKYRDDEFYTAYLYNKETNIFFYDIKIFHIFLKNLGYITYNGFKSLLTWYIVEYVSDSEAPKVDIFDYDISYKEFDIELDTIVLDRYVDEISKYFDNLDEDKINRQKYKVAALNAVLDSKL